MNRNPSLPENERERLEALINFSILEKMPVAELELIVKTAALLCQTPVALIAVLDGDKHHIRSSVGLNIYDLRSDFNFCHEIAAVQEFLEIPDAFLHPELIRDPMVMGHPNYRYFAGVPILTGEGHTIGSLCVIDHHVRQLSKDRITALHHLSGQITHMLSLRKQNKNLQTELNQLLNERINQTEIDLAAYKFALDQSSGVAITDKNGYIRFANSKFCSASGYIKEELLGRAYNVLNSGHHPEVFFRDMWQTISNGGLWQGEILNKDKKGNLFWVDCSIIPFLDKKGKPYQYMAIQQDITEKKSAQERMALETRLMSILSENENIELSLQHITEQICYRLDWEIGVYRSVDKNTDSLKTELYYQISYPHHDALKKTILETVYEPGDGLPGKVWSTKKPVWVPDLESETRIRYKINARQYGFRSSLCFPIMFNNHVIGVMQFFGKKSRKADQGLLQMLESTGLQTGAFIERKKAEEELLKAKKQAEESVISKDQFLANMSHEIRTPMNAIIGFTDLLSQTGLNEKQKEYAHSVRVAGGNLLAIINDILDFSKIESGAIAIEKAPADLRRIAKNVYDLLSISAGKKQLKFTYSIAPGLPATLECDALRLNQILINLVGNAIKFTEQGSVHFEIMLSKSEAGRHHVLFRVRDTGIGIQSDQREKIFERFNQVDNEINRKYEGTGLGLSISKNLIEMMGGTLEMRSEENTGSEFWFTLAMNDSGRPEARLDESDPKSHGLDRPPRILVIEDNYLNQKLAKNVLQNFGYETELALNGQIGLEMLRQMPFDLVLMDLQMPELDGYETTRLIRKELGMDIPVIAMTAHSIRGEKEKCLAAGMNDFISKPFNPQELQQKINMLIPTPAAEAAAKEKTNLHAPEAGQERMLAYLNELSGGDSEFELDMIAVFLRQVPDEIGKIRIALQNNHYQTARELCHKLKSSLDIFGLEQLSENLSRHVRAAGESGEPSQAMEALLFTEKQLKEFYPKLADYTQSKKSKTNDI